MTTDVEIAHAGMALRGAARLMADRQVRRLPVTDQDKRPVGIVPQGGLATRADDDDLVGQTVKEISEKPDDE
jgi:CBS domain-containing protein